MAMDETMRRVDGADAGGKICGDVMPRILGATFTPPRRALYLANAWQGVKVMAAGANCSIAANKSPWWMGLVR